MANQEHLRIVGQGREAMEAWRLTHPDLPLDLRGAVLPQANLGRVNLAYADLSEANLSGATLFRADLSHAQLEHCNLSGAELSRANLGQANLAEANLVKANLGGADLDGANLSGANLFQADLIQCSLHGANLGRAVLSEAVLRRAFLTNADLRRAVLTTTDLLQADLGQADLRWSILRRADLGGVNLAGADLTFATLDHTHMDQAKLSGARLDGTVIIGCDLSVALGLEAMEHLGPSSVGLDTIACSPGKLPIVFLRGIGLSDAMIAQVRALPAEPRQGFTCFIAYSSHDQDRADRVYADLQKKGVRCWYYPDTTGANRRVWENLDRAIRVFDKVVVICSEASLQTQAVVDQVERALNQEVPETPRPAGAVRNTKSRGNGQEVLFPIRIDQYVLDGWQHPRQAEVAARATLDFTGWDKAPRKYRRALGQLLHALDPKAWPEPR